MKQLIIPILLVALLSCGSEANKAESKSVTIKSPESKTAIQEDAVMKKGRVVYRSNCMACHQKDGSGLSRINPPLTNTEWVIGDKTRLINIVLNGFDKKIEVNEVKYNSMMASFSYLSDEDIAAVLTYVRNSFGNNANAITVEEVTNTRANKVAE